jgi:hypothetical protein
LASQAFCPGWQQPQLMLGQQPVVLPTHQKSPPAQ